MKGEKQVQLDPLYVIFEQHLYNFQDDDLDRKTFIDQVLQDYLSHLRKLNISVPKSLEQPIVDELSEQIKVMLIKKIYGCLSIQDYQKKLPTRLKRAAKTRYTRLAKSKLSAE